MTRKPREAAESLARDIGISLVYAEVDDSAKANILKGMGGATVWIGDGASGAAARSIAASSVSVSLAGFATVPRDPADVVLLKPGWDGFIPLLNIAREHRGRIAADYRVVYAANLLGAAGGLLAGLGSLESGLISNLGSAFIFLKHLRELRGLITRAETAFPAGAGEPTGATLT